MNILIYELGIYKWPTKFWMWLAMKLPKKMIYFCAMRLIADATTGEYSTTIVSELGAMDALERFDELHKIN